MSPTPLLVLLGVTLILPRVKTLTCQQGTLNKVYNVTELPLQWTAEQGDCEEGWGCQDTMMLIHNGPLVNLVLIKGCTQDPDQEVQVTEHRSSPGLSITSYTHVCRNNLCNNLANSIPLWEPLQPLTTVTPPSEALQCPICMSTNGCPERGTKFLCPPGTTDCYNGVVTLSKGDTTTNMRVQGCLAQGGCNLLNGTQRIGALSLSENCNANDFLSCHSGIMVKTLPELSREPVEWTTYSSKMCNIGEVCQETLLLIDSGYKSLLLGSKGCTLPGTQDSQKVSIHSGPPNVLAASYTHVCNSNWCNKADNSSVLLNTLPRPASPAPEGFKCPVCVNVFGICWDSKIITCPVNATYCYTGYIHLNGGGVSTIMNVQGCMVKSSSRLFKNTQNIGVFSVIEETQNEPPSQDGVAPAPYLTWVEPPTLP
ncbi:PREDICTED: CD177 antigen [Chrysochloris asiatica]|uniref:CD177 antigen n=1 Tax=Chrysochloris asiatica TaxID=185453 RepID=A0A9B0TVH8_CHRAS|nr:PREDICTED: CD177 antigen [Chrysochloris asiatica]